MRSGEYTTRRSMNYVSSSSWTRNQNIVRHERKNLGPISLIGMFLMLITVMGMIYLTQGTKATSYDYALDELDTEIAELTAEKEDLNSEKARLTSIAASENSTVAANMPVLPSSAYVAE